MSEEWSKQRNAILHDMRVLIESKVIASVHSIVEYFLFSFNKHVQRNIMSISLKMWPQNMNPLELWLALDSGQ